MNHTVRFVTIWSGPLPAYLPLFLLTAGRNRAFEFVFVADSPAPHHLLEGGLPPNVTWIEQSLPDLLAEISQQLGLTLPKTDPYKLCDYKPTFGHTLPTLLGDADFWGHIDCDMVLGDLSRFLTDAILDAHDIVGLRGRQFIHGPLTLYRNTESVNQLFTTAEDWEETLANPVMQSFTETCKWWAWKNQTRPEDAPESFTEAVLRAEAAGDIRVYDEDHIEEGNPQDKPLSLRWIDGVLTDNQREREVAYYHLVTAKNSPLFRTPPWKTLPDDFEITSAGIRGADETMVAFQANRLSHGAPPLLHKLATRIRRRLNT